MDRVIALSEVFRAFAEVTTDYAGLLRTVAEKLTDLIGDGCMVSLADDNGRWIEPSAAAARDDHATTLIRGALARFTDRDGSGHAGHVVRTGKATLLAEIEPADLAARAEPAFADVVRQLGIRSFMSLPLDARGRRLGALSLVRYRAHSVPFTEHDLAFAQSIGDHAALAISNAQLFESLQREREKAKTYVALVESSHDFVAMADFTGRVRFVNAAGRALCGIGPEVDVAALSLADFHTESGLERAAIIREKGSWQGEGVLRHFGTGALIPTQINSFLARDADGQPLCFATVQHDLRETKRLEDELRQAQKMEALGRLAGGVAHDFNNLLTVILSYSAMLAKTLPPDSRNARDVEQIARAGERAADLTRQLLAFSRRQVLEPKAVDLGAVVLAMDGLIRRLVGEDIELRIRLAQSVPAVLVDAGQVEQVVMNLVINARDAMQGGGVLTLETARADGAAILSVGDTGTGIDEATCARIFEPFFTTKERGTGLGLATVAGIVEQSGGTVTVDSILGRGTTFRVSLPAATTPPPVAQPRTITALHGKGKILLVEDEVAVRGLVRDVLRGAGYDVVAAEDPEAALAAIADPSATIDLLLTDVIMPRLSGPQVAARFAASRPGARILYMSGYTDDKLGHHGVLDPEIELIQKPLTPDTLLRKVRALLTSR